MLQLCPMGRCWIVLFVIVIGGLITTVDLIKLETGGELINTDEKETGGEISNTDEKESGGELSDTDKSDSPSKPLEDEGDYDADTTTKCENLGEKALKRILKSRSNYASGHMMTKANAHTIANTINANYENFLPFLSRKVDDEMRMCQGVGEEALRGILRSRSNYQSGYTMNQQAIGRGNNKGTGGKNNKGTGGKNNKGTGGKNNKGKGGKKPKKPKKHKSKKSGHKLANTINAEYAGNSESGRRSFKKHESFLPTPMKNHMNSMPLEEVEKKLRNAKDAYDIMRIFLKDKHLSDKAIEEILGPKKRARRSMKNEAKPHDLGNSENAENTEDSEHKDTFLEDLAEAERHFKEQISDPLSQCQQPQPKAIYVKQPMKPDSLLPACTIVFRCRNDSGCCKPGEACVPTKRQEIRRLFMGVEIDKNGKTKQEIITKTFTEDMGCRCRQLPQHSDCPQKCPSVFRMRRRGKNCVCDCDSKARDTMECKRIKRGIEGLNKEDLNCVIDGHCAAPACSAGQFDVGQGKCPKKQKNVEDRPPHLKTQA